MPLLLLLLIVALFGFSLAGVGSSGSGSGTSHATTTSAPLHRAPLYRDSCRGAIPGNTGHLKPMPKGCLPAESGGLSGPSP